MLKPNFSINRPMLGSNGPKLGRLNFNARPSFVGRGLTLRSNHLAYRSMRRGR
jgi:hypothetical protein